jgi:hypothetical protein
MRTMPNFEVISNKFDAYRIVCLLYRPVTGPEVSRRLRLSDFKTVST